MKDQELSSLTLNELAKVYAVELNKASASTQNMVYSKSYDKKFEHKKTVSPVNINELLKYSKSFM